MFASIGTFLAGMATAYLLTWPAFVVLCLLGILFEHNGRRGWAVFTGLVTLAVSYFFFAVPLTVLAYYVGAYAVAGLVWSFWRYGRYVKASVERIKADSYIKDTEYARYAAELAPSKNVDTITAWVIIWPFSVVENLTGDIISVAQYMVTNAFKSVYNSIYNRMVSDLVK